MHEIDRKVVLICPDELLPGGAWTIGHRSCGLGTRSFVLGLGSIVCLIALHSLNVEFLTSSHQIAWNDQPTSDMHFEIAGVFDFDHMCARICTLAAHPKGGPPRHAFRATIGVCFPTIDMDVEITSCGIP